MLESNQVSGDFISGKMAIIIAVFLNYILNMVKRQTILSVSCMNVSSSNQSRFS